MTTADGPRVRAALSADPLEPATILAGTGSAADGAALLFVGRVRRRNRGRVVEGLHYEAYGEMALEVLRRIAGEAVERFGLGAASVAHRTGDLAVGEVAVCVAVAAEHRAPCFEAGPWIMGEIKARLPIWKRESYADGETRWLEGERVTPATEEA